MKELVCEHVAKKKRRYILLSSKMYKIGKSLDNDVVLLDAQVPSYLGSIEKVDGDYVLNAHGCLIPLGKHKHLQHGYRFWIRDYRKVSWSIVGIFIALMSVLFVQRTMVNRPAKLDSYTLPARGTYGNTNAKEPMDHVAFSFENSDQKYKILHYTSGNIETENDLELLMNGKLFSYATISPDKWNVESTVVIPQSFLTKHNSLTFQFRGDSKQPWAVRDIHIETSDEQPINQSGLELSKIAEKFFHERNVRKGNLVRAIQTMNQAKEFYEMSHQEMPAEYVQLFTNMKKEKQKMINDYWMVAQKFRQQGYTQKSNTIFYKLMDELIDPMDPDRILVQKEMKESN